jgi:hypothetical protein
MAGDVKTLLEISTSYSLMPSGLPTQDGCDESDTAHSSIMLLYLSNHTPLGMLDHR